MWMIMVWFQPFQKVISNPIFCPLYTAKIQKRRGKNASKHRIWPVKSFIHHKQNGQGSITFSISLQDIWCNGIGLKWHRLMVGRRQKEEGMFTLNELLFPLELSASPPSAVRWSELFSHHRTIRGSKKMILLCYVPAIFRGVKAFQCSVHINSLSCSKQAHTRFTAGQVPPGSRVSRDSLRSGVLRLGSVQHCGVSLTLGYGSKC